MSNDTPPHPRLADFGFTTMAFDPVQPMACSAQLEGGTITFMSPELLVPQEFGKQSAVPTLQADIYAFGLVIFQVSAHGCSHRAFIRMLSPGPYRRNTIPQCSAIGPRTLCSSREAPR